MKYAIIPLIITIDTVLYNQGEGAKMEHWKLTVKKGSFWSFFSGITTCQTGALLMALIFIAVIVIVIITGFGKMIVLEILNHGAGLSSIGVGEWLTALGIALAITVGTTAFFIIIARFFGEWFWDIMDSDNYPKGSLRMVDLVVHLTIPILMTATGLVVWRSEFMHGWWNFLTSWFWTVVMLFVATHVCFSFPTLFIWRRSKINNGWFYRAATWFGKTTLVDIMADFFSRTCRMIVVDENNGTG